MNQDRDRLLFELAHRNPFWVCVLVFGLLALDTGVRLAGAVSLRKQLDEAQLVQAQNIGRLSAAMQALPQFENRLQALSLGLIQIAQTNPAAGQIVREFNIQWNPGPESLLAPPALPPLTASPAAPVIPATPAPAPADAPPTAPSATNAPAAE